MDDYAQRISIDDNYNLLITGASLKDIKTFTCMVVFGINLMEYPVSVLVHSKLKTERPPSCDPYVCRMSRYIVPVAQQQHNVCRICQSILFNIVFFLVQDCTLMYTLCLSFFLFFTFK